MKLKPKIILLTTKTMLKFINFHVMDLTNNYFHYTCILMSYNCKKYGVYLRNADLL